MTAQARGLRIVEGEQARIEMAVGAVEHGAVSGMNRRQIRRVVLPVVYMTGAALLGPNLRDVLAVAHFAGIGKITADHYMQAMQVGHFRMSIGPGYVMADDAVLPGRLQTDSFRNPVTHPAGYSGHVALVNSDSLIVARLFVTVGTTHGVNCRRVAGSAVSRTGSNRLLDGRIRVLMTVIAFIPVFVVQIAQMAAGAVIGRHLVHGIVTGRPRLRRFAVLVIGAVGIGTIGQAVAVIIKARAVVGITLAASVLICIGGAGCVNIAETGA